MSSRRPRFRYIAFRVDGPRAFREEEVLAALQDVPERPWLIEFRGTRGLVRCGHLRKDATIRALVDLRTIAGEAVRVVTLGTSGTIRRASAKYLRDREDAATRRPKEAL